MLFTLPKIRTDVRSNFNQAGSLGFLSDSEIDVWINEGYSKYSLMLMIAHEGYFETAVPLDITAQSEEVVLPNNFSSNQKKFLKTTILERQLSNRRVPLEYRRRYAANDINVTSGSAVSDHYLPTYCFRGNSIILEPTPDTSEIGGLRLVFQAMPSRLFSSSPLSAGASTIQFPTTADPRDDYYNESRIYIISGTGESQLRIISDYAGSTRMATVSVPWTVTPAVTSVFSTLIHDDFPEIFHELLALYATKCAFMKERSPSIKLNFDGTRLKELEKQFMDYIENRTEFPVFTRAWNLEIE